jgi:hypothetical protein
MAVVFSFAVEPKDMKHIILISVLLAGCGHGDGSIDSTIGDPCFSDRNCDQSCYMGGDFPGGFCSLSCIDDLDCPGDSYCMAAAGGVCMFYCPPFDCSRLGPGWQCRERSRRNGGTAFVCSG